MKIEDFENLILQELQKVTISILNKNKSPLISAKSRAGAEISALLEKEFVIETKSNIYLKGSKASPVGATKNPWDAMTYFCIKEHKELIWIDFKAIKVQSADSNPDIGTPDKIINLIEGGHFYLVYIFVYYKETLTGLDFVPKPGSSDLVKLYFLKDIHHSFRRNPKNQLQVNISKEPEKRTRAEFIDLLFEKIIESHKRQIAISKKILEKIDKDDIKSKLKDKNKKQEQIIKKI